MQFYVGTERAWGAHPRIADVECDLGIAGYQRAAWDDFVETLVALQETINGIDRIDRRLGGDRPPSLPDLMGQRKVRLAAELELASTLKASTEGLYRSLTARQRARADRLLPRRRERLEPGRRPPPAHRRQRVVEQEVSVDGVLEGPAAAPPDRLSPGRAPLSQLQMCERYWTLPPSLRNSLTSLDWAGSYVRLPSDQRVKIRLVRVPRVGLLWVNCPRRQGGPPLALTFRDRPIAARKTNAAAIPSAASVGRLEASGQLQTSTTRAQPHED
jgi:hypothetical protein